MKMGNKPSLLLMTSRSAGGFNIAPPLGLYRLKNFIQQDVSTCDILDFDLENENEYLGKAEQGKYDIIGMSVSHINMVMDLETLVRFRHAAQVSGKRVLFIAGGQEAALNYTQWLQSNLVDVIFLGFAERSLQKFCSNLGRIGKEAPLKDIAKDIKGLSFCAETGEVLHIPSNVLTEEEFELLSFDNVMTMDIPYEIYWNKMRLERARINTNTEFVFKTARLYTSSHCPRRCGFCSSQSFITSSQKNVSPIFSITAEQIYEIVKHYARRYEAEGFLFSDDDFPIGTLDGIERVRRFCRLIIDAKHTGNLPDKLKFFCQSRVADFLDNKTVRHDLIKLMREAGFDNTGLGIETLSNRLLKAPSVNKTGVTVSDCKAVIDALLEEGVIPIIFIIIGIPESSVGELEETICEVADYIRKGVDVAVTARLRVNPGSPLCECGSYPISSTAWVSPVNGKTLLVADYFIPWNPIIEMIIGKVQEKAEEEVRLLCAKYGWNKSMAPKTIVGIATLIATARLINREDIVEKFIVLLRDIVDNQSSLLRENR